MFFGLILRMNQKNYFSLLVNYTGSRNPQATKSINQIFIMIKSIVVYFLGIQGKKELVF